MHGFISVWQDQQRASGSCARKSRTNSNRSQPGTAAKRAGVSTVEILVATALLATAITGIGRLAHATQQGLHDRELATRLHWEIGNAREQIGSWGVEGITVARIEALPFSPALTKQLDGLRWHADVQSISEPATALQVSLAIQCLVNSQAAQPAKLTFWIASPAPPETTQNRPAD